MEWIGFLGIFAAIVVFFFLSFRRLNLFFNSVLAASIVILTSGTPILETIKGTYMGSMSGFLKGYLILFALSALFGKVMEESGAVRRIALVLSGLTRKSKKHQKTLTVLILPIFYFILSYVGISGFVLAFTVVAIGRDLFEECDIPMMYYCYGSAGIYPSLFVGGSMQTANIISTTGFQVATTASMGLSLGMLVIVWIVLYIQISMDVKRAEKRQEGFLPSGAEIKKLQIAAPRPVEELPHFAVAIVPLLIPVFCIVFFKTDVLVSMGIAIIACFVLMFKYIKNPKDTLNTGVASSANAVINVAAAAGLAAVIQASPGFSVIMGAVGGLPFVFPPLALIAFMAAVLASSSSALPTLMPTLIEQMAATGISTEVAARLVAGGGFTYMLPHSPGVVNSISLTKLDYKRAAWFYFKSSFFPGFFAMMFAVLMVALGVVH